MKTLVTIGYREIGDRQFQHGAEIPAGLLPRAQIDRLVDEGKAVELDQDERQSLYKIFHHFSAIEGEKSKS